MTRRAMRSGLVSRAEGPGVLLCDQTMERMSLHCGDYVEIASDEQGTHIVRQIKGANTKSKVRPNYVYMDQESLRFLHVQLDELLEVWPAAIGMDCP